MFHPHRPSHNSGNTNVRQDFIRSQMTLEAKFFLDLNCLLPVGEAFVIFLLCLLHLLLLRFHHLPLNVHQYESDIINVSNHRWFVCQASFTLCGHIEKKSFMKIRDQRKTLQLNLSQFGEEILTCTSEPPYSCLSQPCPSPWTSSADPRKGSDGQKAVE